MKFAFILDTSPLMQIKKPVLQVPPGKKDSKKTSTGKRGSSKSKDEKSDATTTGMSYFEQSIYAIEEFITVRKKMGAAWK